MEHDPHQTAIIAVHLQHDVITPDGAFDASYTQQRATAALVVNTPVALPPGDGERVGNFPLLGMVGQQGCLIAGTPAASIVEELTPADFVVTYQRASGLVGSELENVPRGGGVDTGIFTGVATDVSMESTARSAEDLGCRSSVLSDACSAAAPEAVHQASLDSLDMLGEVATRAAVLVAVKDAGVPA